MSDRLFLKIISNKNEKKQQKTEQCAQDAKEKRLERKKPFKLWPVNESDCDNKRDEPHKYWHTHTNVCSTIVLSALVVISCQRNVP